MRTLRADEPIATVAQCWAEYCAALAGAEPHELEVSEFAFYVGALAMLNISFQVYASPFMLDRGAEFWQLQRETQERLDELACRSFPTWREAFEIERIEVKA